MSSEESGGHELLELQLLKALQLLKLGIGIISQRGGSLCPGRDFCSPFGNFLATFAVFQAAY